MFYYLALYVWNLIFDITSTIIFWLLVWQNEHLTKPLKLRTMHMLYTEYFPYCFLNISKKICYCKYNFYKSVPFKY